VDPFALRRPVHFAARVLLLGRRGKYFQTPLSVAIQTFRFWSTDTERMSTPWKASFSQTFPVQCETPFDWAIQGLPSGSMAIARVVSDRRPSAVVHCFQVEACSVISSRDTPPVSVPTQRVRDFSSTASAVMTWLPKPNFSPKRRNSTSFSRCFRRTRPLSVPTQTLAPKVASAVTRLEGSPDPESRHTFQERPSQRRSPFTVPSQSLPVSSEAMQRTESRTGTEKDASNSTRSFSSASRMTPDMRSTVSMTARCAPVSVGQRFPNHRRTTVEGFSPSSKGMIWVVCQPFPSNRCREEPEATQTSPRENRPVRLVVAIAVAGPSSLEAGRATSHSSASGPKANPAGFQ
jgi:hypothetical protein